MNQMDMTTGSAIGRLESVGPELVTRHAARITPQMPAQPKPAEVNGAARAAQARPGSATTPPLQPHQPRLEAADIAALHAGLTSGPDGLARKRDLGEMHRHTVKLFETLNTGLGEQQLRKSAEDRSVLIARMDRLEKSVNAMEGAVRIEMAPLIRGMLDEAFAGQAVRREPRRTGALWLTLGLGAGLAVGVIFSGDIAPFAEGLLTNAGQFVARMMGS